jgi:hypothetical protein
MTNKRTLEHVSARRAIFVTAKEVLDLELTSYGQSEIIRSARSLRASHFIMVESYNPATRCPRWAVFDMSTAQLNMPHPGASTINDPKVFEADTPDAAIMWAVSRRGLK